jgi:3'-phosphoadenosine 5'-phosphosulfate (PAPS) 3'-phosphatase
MDSLREAAEAARDLAREGACVALQFAGKVTARDKGHNRGPVTEADLAVERVLVEGLRARRPADAVLSEESPEGADLDAPRLWCVDPIDGTREFLAGAPGPSVMAGLLVGGEPVAGAIAILDPAALFWGWRGGGAFAEVGGVTLPVRLPRVAKMEEAVALHSRRHATRRVRAAMESLRPARTIPVGGVGYKVACILRGDGHLYFHPNGGVAWWDSVAPAAVMLAAGGFVSDGRGRPLVYAGDYAHEDGLLFAVPDIAAEAVRRLTSTSSPRTT